MRSYLDLVPISAKVHRKQNSMSVFCIVLAVFLVTAIFGMADMFIRGQILLAQKKDGKWHVIVRDITDEEASRIAASPSVKSTSRYGVINFRGDQGYLLSGKVAVLCGADSGHGDMFVDFLAAGEFPRSEKEALITENAEDNLGLQIGDSVEIDTADGTKLQYTISGFARNVLKTQAEDAYGIIITTEAFRAFYPDVESDELNDYESILYVQFGDTGNLRRDIDNLKSTFQLSEEQVSENTMLIGLLGQSRDSFMMQIYAAAAVLVVLVLFAGVMMIAGSLNSNVAQRTEFFGLMRCIGATPGQVMRLVRREALGWCRFAIPVGVGSGVIVIWILCAVLRGLSPKYFEAMPAFGVSVPSVVAGIVVGFLTVMLAARSPAKRASKVSPLVAASGNAGDTSPVRKAANIRLFKPETALGIHHAKSSLKNLILMTGSFAFSIILFLSFSVTVTCMQHALTPLQPWRADLSIISPELTCSVDRAFLEYLEENEAVRRAYGRMFAYDIPVTVNGEQKQVDLISYEERQFGWAKDYVLEGSLEAVREEANTGLIVNEPQNTIQVGDTIKMDIDGRTAEIKIVGMLSNSPFHNAEDVGIIICSEDTFRQLTGQTDYTVIDVQLTRGATDEDVNAIHQTVGTGFFFSDMRIDNSNVRGSYYCFVLFVYGFLVVIALITIFNVINSIAMSVAARTKLYGAFRAIGLSTRQLSRMVFTEAATYAIAGSAVGTVLGLVCNKLLFGMLVSYRWGDAWVIPWDALGIILLIVALSVVLAVCGPIRRIHNMSIVDTINAH